MATIDWLILAAYLVLIIFMGGWFARRQNSTEAFFLGGRSVPWWAVGFSFFGSSISTGTFLAFPGQGYGGDWIPPPLPPDLPRHRDSYRLLGDSLLPAAGPHERL